MTLDWQVFLQDDGGGRTYLEWMFEAWGWTLSVAGSAWVVAMLSGCINIQAPDKPIVIQLDINIRAEVLYALAEDAANTIDENADIF